MYTGIAVSGIIIAIILHMISPSDDPIERTLLSIAFFLAWLLVLLGQYFDRKSGNRS